MLPELVQLLTPVGETALLRQAQEQATCEWAASEYETSQDALACMP